MENKLTLVKSKKLTKDVVVSVYATDDNFYVGIQHPKFKEEILFKKNTAVKLATFLKLYFNE